MSFEDGELFFDLVDILFILDIFVKVPHAIACADRAGGELASGDGVEMD